MKHALALCLVLAAAACGPKASPDEPGPPPSGDECTSHSDCDPGLVCQAGMCLPYEGKVGDPCYDELDCEMGLGCEKGTCVEASPDQ